jgi:hypothetical protein
VDPQASLIAVLESSPTSRLLAESVAREGLSTLSFTSLESLTEFESLASVAVLVFRLGRERLGSLLIALGRMNHDYPGLRKLAIVDEGIPVALASYLSACSVDFLHTCLDASGADRVATTVRRIAEQKAWSLERSGP